MWAFSFLSEDGEIKYIKFDDYVSFMLGAKAANNELFISSIGGIATTQKWNRISKIGILYFVIFT